MQKPDDVVCNSHIDALRPTSPLMITTRSQTLSTFAVEILAGDLKALRKILDGLYSPPEA